MAKSTLSGTMRELAVLLHEGLHSLLSDILGCWHTFGSTAILEWCPSIHDGPTLQVNPVFGRMSDVGELKPGEADAEIFDFANFDIANFYAWAAETGLTVSEFMFQQEESKFDISLKDATGQAAGLTIELIQGAPRYAVRSLADDTVVPEAEPQLPPGLYLPAWFPTDLPRDRTLGCIKELCDD
jgi:hypothetical protein